MQEKPEACIFCRACAQQGADRERLILVSDPLITIMLNRYPYVNGHLMVAPRRHTADLGGLTEAEVLALFRGAARCQDALKRSCNPNGYNIGMNLGKAAGAGVEDHMHLHVVPRWSGDSSFMGAVGETRVISEALLATYDRLLPYFSHPGEEVPCPTP